MTNILRYPITTQQARTLIALEADAVAAGLRVGTPSYVETIDPFDDEGDTCYTITIEVPGGPSLDDAIVLIGGTHADLRRFFASLARLPRTPQEGE